MKTITTSQQIYNILRGSWIFTRTLIDKKKMTGTSATETVTGVADFKEIRPGVLNYKEQGQWLIQNKVVPTTQQYQYRYDPEKDTVNVYFLEQSAEPRFFHQITVKSSEAKSSTMEASGEHQCAADNYKAHYLFSGNEQFTLFYYVKGTHKDYTSKTVFKRVSEYESPGTTSSIMGRKK
jgi:hypothetical protein